MSKLAEFIKALDPHAPSQQDMNEVCLAASIRLTMNLLGLPFDLARAQYARAVQAGFIERSMLASRDFARALAAIERLTLGPWARRV